MKGRLIEMKTDAELISGLMTDEDKEELSKIFSPVVTGIQPEDSRRGLCVMPDGEIRHYGICEKKTFNDAGKRCYIASRDGGLTWKRHLCAPGELGASFRIPWSGRYVTVVGGGSVKGAFCLYSDTSPADTDPVSVKICDFDVSDMFQPKACRKIKRIFCTGHTMTGCDYHPVFMFSDDDGEHWETRVLDSAPKYEPTYPSIDQRWENNGAEPIAAERPDGSILLLTRTSQDFLYSYESYDGGNTWTDKCVPTQFHCTLTTPYFLELADGRTVFFWNNTQPLPEMCQANELPTHEEGFSTDMGEDVFTNRDANHAAVTEDFKTWKGFRELALNEIRNEPDFRCHGGIESSADKSIHQFQAIELPCHKILVAYGQHEASRRIAVFDPEWLYENGRNEDFRNGLTGVSTQMYVRSWSGCALWTGHIGHCAWNRTNGALLVPDPDEEFREDLQICRVHDSRLVSEKQGAVWNFPLSNKGEIVTEIKRLGAGIRYSLCDRWYNPIDTTPAEEAPFSFSLTDDLLRYDKWYTLRFTFDTEAKTGELYLGQRHICHVRMRYAPDFGFSYLHLQTLAECEDMQGTLIRCISMKSL